MIAHSSFFSSAEQPLSIEEARAQFQSLERQGKSRLHGISLRGRIERIRCKEHGAAFFDLVDTTSIEVVITHSRRASLLPELREGAHVVASGSIRRYRGSDPQLELTRCVITPAPLPEPAAIPALSNGRRLPLVKERRAVPTLLARLALITSPGSEALTDVADIVAERAPWVEVVLCPSPVQGQGAADAMTRALFCCNLNGKFGAILICRGGSSSKDAFAPFADADLQRAIRLSRIPVAMAIGHATDRTPADDAAIHSFATPTHAAVSLVPDREVIRRDLDRIARTIGRRLFADGFSPGSLAHYEAPCPALLAGGRTPAMLLQTALQRLHALDEQLTGAAPWALHADALAYTAAADLALAYCLISAPPLPMRQLEME
jgi:exodeoxyribonuclease VII large subunit